jgi:hypothetical protein
MAAVTPSSPGPALRTIASLVLLAGVAGICLWVGGTAIRLVRVARHRIETWRPVPATVQQIAVETRRAGRGGRAYAPVVRYSYTVGGVAYSASRVTVLDEASSQLWAERIAARFHLGETVTAFYDPLHPGEAFLLPIGGGPGGSIMALAVVPIGIAVWLALRARRAAESADPRAESAGVRTGS